MKVSRERNIIKMEVEESDCLPGETPETMADYIMAGIKLGGDPELIKNVKGKLNQDEGVRKAVDEELQKIHDSRDANKQN